MQEVADTVGRKTEQGDNILLLKEKLSDKKFLK
jgi:hypothetical protein